MTRLTNEQIAALEGQPLSDAVAERVMGWKLNEFSRWTPHFCRNDASVVMDRIEELCLTEEYIDALHDGGRLVESDEWDWWLHTASPADRCRAALMAVEGER